MTLARTAIVVMAVVAAFALGVFAGPYLIDRPVTTAQKDISVESKDTPQPVATTGRARTAKPAREVSTPAVAKLSASEPELQKQLKPIMNRGTDMELAAKGFGDAEQFATLAHAARNTEIPFVVLKNRVLEQGKSLAAAIEEFKPKMDGTAEAKRARDEARKTIGAVRADQRADARVAEQ
jgi:hypothetical protein